MQATVFIQHILPVKGLAQFCSTSFQSVQFMNQTEISIINAITVK